MTLTRIDLRQRQPGGNGPGPRRRALVVSAAMGAGHHATADELVRRLREEGHVAERIDVLDLGRPGQGRRLQRTYSFLLRWLPWLYDGAMRFWARWPAPLASLVARSATSYEAGLLREVRDFRPDVVVSVYNLASQALGRLRATRRLSVPVATYVPDPGAHPYWVHPAVDLYLTVLPETARGLAACGACRTVVVRRLVRPCFRPDAGTRADARRRLGLPLQGTIALVNGGAWAAGRLERTVGCLTRSGAALPVTLCGRDEKLRRRLARRGAGVALGWIEDMPSLMAAADVLVDNAGGVTCWEAVASRLPVVIFHPLPGHGRINARTLGAAGVAAYAHSDHELLTAVRLLARSHAPEARSHATEASPGGNGGDGPADPLVALLALSGRSAGPTR